MTNAELQKILSGYPDNYIVQVNSPNNNSGSEDIVEIHVEDEYNNFSHFKGQVYIDLIGGVEWH